MKAVKEQRMTPHRGRLFQLTANTDLANLSTFESHLLLMKRVTVFVDILKNEVPLFEYG